MANRTNDLTPKQLHFCRCLASGMTQAAAYREAYDVGEDTKPKTQQEAASRLMRKAEVRARVDMLIRQREQGMLASSLSDRERVLKKLRDLLDNAVGIPAEQVMLRACDLLGKTQGMYKDVVVHETPRTAAEIQVEIDELLERYRGNEAEADEETDDSADASIH